MKERHGYRVEFSDDGDQVTVVPCNWVTSADLNLLINFFQMEGFKYVRTCARTGGYRFVKERPMDTDDT